MASLDGAISKETGTRQGPYNRFQVRVTVLKSALKDVSSTVAHYKLVSCRRGRCRCTSILGVIFSFSLRHRRT